MPFETFARICVGAPLKPPAAIQLHDDFLASLDLPPDAPSDRVFDALRFDVPKHKRHESDRVRYERAFEAFVDARWDVDFAFGGVSPDGLFERRRGFIFVGVRIEQFEVEAKEIPRHASTPDKPQWLRKGDLSAGSEFAKQFLVGDVRKIVDHASRMYSRAAKDILKDAIARVRPLDVSPQHEPDWAMCRWLVDSEHPSVLTRHGGRNS